MKKNRKVLLGFLILTMVVVTGCYIPEIISSDDLVATKVADSLKEAMQETKAAEVQPTYTPYPTYTPAPTYTHQYYTYTFEDNLPPRPPQGYNNLVPPMPRR